MSNDITFSLVDTNETIYDPLLVASSFINIRVTNYGDSDLTGLGFYISPATSVGDVDFPADYPPETDYEDLITWGSKTVSMLEVTGGIVVVLPTDTGTVTSYITRSAGSKYGNKLTFQDLAAGESAVFSIKFETPDTDNRARRFFVNLNIE